MSKIAVSLAGGGSRGIWQVGAALALNDLKVTYNGLYGSSVGSLNGLLYHIQDFAGMQNLWLNIKNSDVYLQNPIDYALAYKNKYLYDSTPLRNLISKNINFEKLKQNPADFWINTTDLTNSIPYSREIKSFENEQEAIDFALASASPPIYFKSVNFHGRELCDAGVVNNYSITEAINDGYDTLILLMPVPPDGYTVNHTILDVLAQVLSLSMHYYMEREAKSIVKINKVIDTIQSAIEKSKCSVILEDKDFPQKIKLLLVYPETKPTFGLLDFDFKGIYRQGLIDSGYNRCKQILENYL